MSYSNPTDEEISIRRTELAPFDSVNERCALLMMSSIFAASGGIPRSYLDIGSGTGAMVNIARKLGIEAFGVDVINGPESWFIKHDLSTPMYLSPGREYGTLVTDDEQYYMNSNPRFDLVTCLEVAEHIPIKSHIILAESIARHMRSGSILVFSSAPPGQSGDHHVGNRPTWEWRDIFYDIGISYRQDLTMQLSHIWSWAAGPLMWLGANVQVFDI